MTCLLVRDENDFVETTWQISQKYQHVRLHSTKSTLGPEYWRPMWHWFQRGSFTCRGTMLRQSTVQQIRSAVYDAFRESDCSSPREVSNSIHEFYRRICVVTCQTQHDTKELHGSLQSNWRFGDEGQQVEVINRRCPIAVPLRQWSYWSYVVVLSKLWSERSHSSCQKRIHENTNFFSIILILMLRMHEEQYRIMSFFACTGSYEWEKPRKKKTTSFCRYQRHSSTITGTVTNTSDNLPWRRMDGIYS